MEFFYDLEKSWNTFMMYKIYSILINSIFYYNPMREIEERKMGEYMENGAKEEEESISSMHQDMSNHIL